MKLKMTLGMARRRAELVMEMLRPVCMRVEVAGSIRRGNVEVGDIEIVAQPVLEPVADLFGTSVGEASALEGLFEKLRFPMAKNGPRFKQFEYDGVMVDLFLADAATWGMVYTLRTGSADFSKWLVTDRQHGGAMPSWMHCKNGRLWSGDMWVRTPEEGDVFEQLRVQWIKPAERKAGLWGKVGMKKVE